MDGSTLAEIELLFGTDASKLAKLDNARNFVLRIVPELAFVFGLPLQILRAMKKGTEEENALPGLYLSTLSACVRGGFDVAEKLALRQALSTRSSRVAVHKKYEQLSKSFEQAKDAEDLTSAVKRVKRSISSPS
jgi:hypothetical protein